MLELEFADIHATICKLVRSLELGSLTACHSLRLTWHINRLGQYDLDMEKLPLELH
jgi:hypothetical protein